MLIVGDVHGKFDQYLSLIKDHDCSVQIGDLGFNPPELPKNHYFFKGNHDTHSDILHFSDLGNFGQLFLNPDIFFVRGAQSIDRSHRIEGFDWFPNEELSYAEANACFVEYGAAKPKIVLSHDCPQSVCEDLFNIYDHSSTRVLLQAMFDVHKPDLWIFGHHHKTRGKKFFGTRFVCLAELQTFLIE